MIFLYSVYNDFEKYTLYARLFQQITGVEAIGQNTNRNEKTFASIESIFRLLEHKELQLATQQATAANEQAKDAKKEYKKAYVIALSSLAVSVVFGIWQSHYQWNHDNKEDDENSKYQQEVL